MRRTTVVLLGILAVVLFASWFFTYNEKVIASKYVGYSGEARYNDFLAAELLLTELGIESDSRAELVPTIWLPDRYDTVVVHASESLALGDELILLTAWVENGGHLILLPSIRESEFAGFLLSQFGFWLEPVEPDAADDPEQDEDDAEADEESFDYIIDLDYTMVRIVTHEGNVTTATLSDDDGIVAARREWGEGYVTVFASPWYFTNHNIDEYDHARLLMDAVAGFVEEGKTWFVYSTAFPSLWQVIWRNAPYVVVGFAVCLFLWLWSRAPSFGPAEAPDSLARRSILEHIQAAGNFAWRNRSAADLVASSTAAILHEAEFRHPGISRLAPQAQARQIARMTDMGESYVLNALFNQDHAGHREFTRLMKTLQRIRKKL